MNYLRMIKIILTVRAPRVELMTREMQDIKLARVAKYKSKRGKVFRETRTVQKSKFPMFALSYEN